MFLKEEDLPSVIYSYQIEQITEGNTAIVLTALAAAEEECRSYLTPNYMNEYLDGRLIYDTKAIFSATGDQRNPLILQQCIVLAKWHLVILCNADVIYEQAKERYDRATEWLGKLAEGIVNLDTLPTLDIVKNDEDQDDYTPFLYGSRRKFNHE